MSNPYSQFHDQPLLGKQEANASIGDLINPYNGYKLSQPEVDAYNRYTRDFNSVNSRSSQEFYLDQRHKYFVTCGDYDSLPPHVQAILKAKAMEAA